MEIGRMGKAEVAVDGSNTAKTMGSGDLEVFATPAMIALMEKAAVSAVQDSLSEGFSTVGTWVDIRHLAATPVGMKVTAQAILEQVEGKRLLFKVEAFDGRNKIGEGQHERAVVNVEKFMLRASGN